MRSLAVLPFVLGATCCLPAHGQFVEVYGTLSIPHVSNLPTGSTCNTNGVCTEQYRSLTVAGFGGGVTVRLVPLGLVDLGVDFRGSDKPGTPGVQTGMVGFKVTAKPPVLHIRPYGQVSAGYFATSTPNQSVPASTSNFSNKGAAYEVLGGLDLPLLPILDVRVVEIGGGQAFGLFNGKTSGIFTVNTGLVLHF